MLKATAGVDSYMLEEVMNPTFIGLKFDIKN